MSQYSPDLVVLQAATTDKGPEAIEQLLANVLRIVHGEKTEFAVGSAEYAVGWSFYALSVKISAVKRLASLPGSGLGSLRGDSLGQKFASWLNRQAKEIGLSENVHFTLKSDLRSSQYGFF